MNSIYYHDYDTDFPYYAMWKEYMTKYLSAANTFEVHIWNEEEGIISLACRYGEIYDDGWTYGKKVKGKVTHGFINMILDTAEECFDGVYKKMTPFFNIFLDDIFESSHYGTEIHYSGDNLTPQSTMFVNYYSKVTGTYEDIPPYEIVLRNEAGTYIIDEYKNGSSEPVRSFYANSGAYERCLEICIKEKINERETLTEYSSFCGGIQVVKYYDGKDYIRVSTDKMPQMGHKALETVREILTGYMTDENRITE